MPTVTHYLWHRDSVALEADESNAVQSRNVRFPDQYGSLVSQQTASTTNIFHYDALGSTNELTDSQQQVTNSIRYSAFGEIVQQTSSLSVTATWIGQSGYESGGLGSILCKKSTLFGDQFSMAFAGPAWAVGRHESVCVRSQFAAPIHRSERA